MPKQKSAPKTFHHGNLRAELLNNALILLDAEGESAITIRAVARASGVSHAAPTNHFKDRSALLTAVVESQLIILSNDVLAAAKGIAESARLVAVADVFYEYAMRHPHRYMLLWRHDLIDHEQPAINEKLDAIYAVINGSSKNETKAIAFWALIHGYIDLRLSGMFIEKADEDTGVARRHAMIELLQH